MNNNGRRIPDIQPMVRGVPDKGVEVAVMTELEPITDNDYHHPDNIFIGVTQVSTCAVETTEKLLLSEGGRNLRDHEELIVGWCPVFKDYDSALVVLGQQTGVMVARRVKSL